MLAQGVILPFEAWVQAVFVALFIILVVALLAWFSKQQEAWQKFIQARDKDWQGWMDRAEVRSCAQLEAMMAAIGKLGEKLDAHDSKVDARIEAAKEAGEHNAASQPRKTVPRGKTS